MSSSWLFRGGVPFCGSTRDQAPEGASSQASDVSARMMSGVVGSSRQAAPASTGAPARHRGAPVAGEEVRRPDQVPGLLAAREREDAGVLEEAPDDRDHADPLADPLDART